MGSTCPLLNFLRHNRSDHLWHFPFVLDKTGEKFTKAISTSKIPTEGHAHYNDQNEEFG